MGFILKVESEQGSETIELGVENILTAEFNTDTPDDSNARSTDLGASLIVTGKILTPVDGEAADSTIKLAQWSLVPGEKAECYRKVTLQVVASSAVIREVVLTNAYVVDYTEDYGDQEGVGTFYLHMKQKKDKTPDVQLLGGYSI